MWSIWIEFLLECKVKGVKYSEKNYHDADAFITFQILYYFIIIKLWRIIGENVKIRVYAYTFKFEKKDNIFPLIPLALV